MTNNKFKSNMDKLKSEALQIYKDAAPVDTGYLRDHIITKDLPNGGFEVVIEAEYAIETSETGPSAGWIEAATSKFLAMAKSKLNGNTKTGSDK